LLYNYGNSSEAPYSEYFYVGGANTIRAFGVREIGPGNFDGTDLGRQLCYLIQNGEIKLVGNLEYRTKLFGDLNGAIFLDAGNVWDFNNDFVDGGGFPTSVKSFIDQTALGTGVGIRYDMGFLVIRLDWGLAIHCPYDTGKSGYFNVPSFSKAHTLHFAIGYPF
jgi:outer membrane protein assembly factor BamA